MTQYSLPQVSLFVYLHYHSAHSIFQIRVSGSTKFQPGTVLILKDGYIIAEWGDINRVDMTFSVTKSYLSTVAGLAYDKGLITSVTHPVSKYVWDGHSGGGLFISTTDQARFGLLFGREWNWNGDQLISEEWIEMARQSSLANESYGYMWWLNKGVRSVEEAPQSAF